MNPRFSIIIPVYNVAPYLRECLDSVLDQTFADWEAICIDDGSTDGSSAILDRYAAADDRFMVVHQQNEGVEFARQVALDRTQGEYVVWLDADDYFEPVALARYLELIRADPCDMLWFDFIEEDGSRQSRRSQACEENVKALMTGIIDARIWGALWNKVFKRQFIIEHNIRFSGERCETMEDVYFICRLLNANPKMHYVPESYYHYVSREGSLIRREMDDAFVRRWQDAAHCILPLVRGRMDDSVWRQWIMRLKVGIYSLPEISDDVFYSFFPGINALKGNGWAIHHRVLFWLTCHLRCRQSIISLLTVIRKVRHGV